MILFVLICIVVQANCVSDVNKAKTTPSPVANSAPQRFECYAGQKQDDWDDDFEEDSAKRDVCESHATECYKLLCKVTLTDRPATHPTNQQYKFKTKGCDWSGGDAPVPAFAAVPLAPLFYNVTHLVGANLTLHGHNWTTFDNMTDDDGHMWNETYVDDRNATNNEKLLLDAARRIQPRRITNRLGCEKAAETLCPDISYKCLRCEGRLCNKAQSMHSSMLITLTIIVASISALNFLQGVNCH